jgi:VanZ like family
MEFLKKLTSRIFIPLSWTLFTILLLCLPGSAFPGGGFFDIPHFDKVIHVVLFGGMVVLWSLYYLQKNDRKANWHVTVISIAFFTIALGICMEYVQFNFIPNRAFDMGDILANTIAAVIFAIFFYFRKPANLS